MFPLAQELGATSYSSTGAHAEADEAKKPRLDRGDVVSDRHGLPQHVVVADEAVDERSAMTGDTTLAEGACNAGATEACFSHGFAATFGAHAIAVTSGVAVACVGVEAAAVSDETTMMKITSLHVMIMTREGFFLDRRSEFLL